MDTILNAEDLWVLECEYKRQFSVPRSKKAITSLISRNTYISPELEDEIVRCMKEVDFHFYDDLVEKFGVSRNFLKHIRTRYKLPPISGGRIKKHQNILKVQGLRKCPSCNEVKDLTTEFYESSPHRCIHCEKVRHKLTYPTNSVKHLTSLDRFLRKKLKVSQDRFKKLKLRDAQMLHTLTIDELHDLYGKQNGRCFYTGRELKLAMKHINHDSLSIDRIDSSKGYTLTNVVLCCSIVNTMKMDHSLEDFKSICLEVAQNFTR